MARQPITGAIIAEANDEVNRPYSTSRKIQGYVKNIFNRTKHNIVGGSDDVGSQAKVVGRNLVTVVPDALAAGAAEIPVVGGAAETVASAVGERL